MIQKKVYIAIVLIFTVMLQGCGTMQSLKRTDELEYEVARLQDQLGTLRKEKDAELDQLRRQGNQMSKEVIDLENVKKELEKRLKREIGEYKAKLEMTERGLVITFLTEVFFDSGKDIIKEEGEGALGNVGEVLNEDIPDTAVAIEGHTDNEPIKYSGWKSNWELSSARALAVLHYLIDTCHIRPERLSAVGYGEYRPVNTNDTDEGRRKNRRVEIIILPSHVKKVSSER